MPSNGVHKILKSEFSKWNHPIRMKFLVGAATQQHANELLYALLECAHDKKAALVGPLVFEQVYYLADNWRFKTHAFELAQKSLALRPPKQLHIRCDDMARKGQWLWAGALFPYIKEQKVILDVYRALIHKMTACLGNTEDGQQFERLSGDLHNLFTKDSKGLEHWNILRSEVACFAVSSIIEAQLSKESLKQALGDVQRPSIQRKL